MWTDSHRVSQEPKFVRDISALGQNQSSVDTYHLSPDYFLGTEYFLELGANAA